MSPRAPFLRSARPAALLALGGLAVHQLRYLIAFGSEDAAVLHREGHSYLAEAVPVLLALAIAAIAARLVVAATDRRSVPGASRSTISTALRYALALICVFSAQELAEGVLAEGHPAGAAALVGGGAWVALPLSFALGLVAALAERALDRAEAVIAVVLAGPALRRQDSDSPELACPRLPLRLVPRVAQGLAFGFARRPPPAIPVS